MAASKKKKSPVKSKKAAAPKAKAKAKVKVKVKAKAPTKSQPAVKAKPNAKSNAKPKATASSSSSRGSLQAFLTPLDNRLVVELDTTVRQQTDGGVWLAPSATEKKPSRGKVLAVGRGRRNKKGQVFPMDVAVGDEVLYGAFTGTTIDWQGAQLLILREEDILGIVSAS